MAHRRKALKQSTPTDASLWARPFGYALCAVVWLVLFLVVAGMSLGALPLAFSDMGPLRASDGLARALADPAEGLALIAVLVLMPLIWGGVFAWLLVATGAMAALSVVFVARALNKDFSSEKLSFSTMDDAVMGGPSPDGVAMSLQPVRSTPVSDVLIPAYWAGWKPGVNLYLSATILGAAYLFTVIWVFWPVDGWLWQLLCAVITVTLAVWGAWRYRRALLERPLPGYFER
ncbi:O-antigen/teichoic acid export membrane protein [Arthrobacter sp. CAN_A2]|uniref:hypothetical protein n=1 Tax=Arthrobacter sp. CAN_A2 TaxID=2787718 RepID=UPI0018EFB0D1